MQDAQTLFSELRSLAAPMAVNAIERLIHEAPDDRLNRVNPLAFAAEHELAETDCIAAFLHASRLGLFELSWNVICGLCGGVLNSADSLKALDQEQYHCSFCTTGCEPVLDERVEVTFTVDPRIRRIAAHDPDTLPLWDYVRQVYLSSGSDLPADLTPLVGEVALDALELLPGSRVERTFQMPKGLVIVFDPVTHGSMRLEFAGDPAREAAALTIAIEADHQPAEPVRLAPGPLRLTLENRTDRRTLPILWVAGEALLHLLEGRIPHLTGQRLLSHQSFRDIYGTKILGTDQRFRITRLTFLFTDIKGSTALYERVGDLAAFDLVRAHFRALTDIITAESGALVKTIGDAVMATFPSPAEGIAAALRMHGAMTALNARRGSEDLLLKIGVHTGPCLAVTLNDSQDYFGQAVNTAARVQGLAPAGKVLATEAVLNDPAARALLTDRGLAVTTSTHRLRGIDHDMVIHEIG